MAFTGCKKGSIVLLAKKKTALIAVFLLFMLFF